MPIYTFTCISCDISKDQNAKIDERDRIRVECPNCGNAMIRAIDAPGSVWAPTAGGYR